MASDESWKDLAPDIRESAREAARGRGLSLDQWVRSAIIDQAAGERAGKSAAANQSPSAALLEQRFEELNRQVESLSRTGAAFSAQAGREPAGVAAGLKSVEKRLLAFGETPEGVVPTKQLLDVLGKLNTRLTNVGERAAAGALPEPASAEAPQAESASTPPTQAEPALAQVEPAPPIEDWAADLDRAVAEIAERQRALLAEQDAPAPAQRAGAMPASPQPPAASPATRTPIDELQGRLDHLAEELRVLRQPGGVGDAIGTLRGQLAEIAQTLSEAAPRRVLQTLENEVRTLVTRFDEARRQGGDREAFAGLESKIDALCASVSGMASAENLAPFREEVRALDRKVEQAGARGGDAEGLSFLQQAVGELREIASRAATGDALIALAEEVQSLGERIDRVSTGKGLGEDVLATLDRRFQALAADLNARGVAASGPTPDDLVSIIEALSNKIDALEIGRDSLPAMEAIVGHLTRLTERIESSGAQLDRIERSFAALLERMNTLRDEDAMAADARLSLAERAEDLDGGVGSLRQHLAALSHNQQQSDQRTQETLEAVHDTLERLVDRLAGIEAGLGGTPASLTAPRPRQTTLAPSIAPTDPVVPETRSRPASAPPVASERRPIDPSLPADYPLEPGAARTRATPAERIAASEAALGGAKPASVQDPKANFIAAARRAAQAAASMSAAPEGTPEVAKTEPSVLGSLTQKITRRRPLLLVGVALCIVGGIANIAVNKNPVPGSAQIAALWSALKPAVPAPDGKASHSKTADTHVPAKKEALAATASAPATDSAPGTAATGSAGAAPAGTSHDTAATSDPQPRQPAEANAVPTISPLTIASIQLPAGDVTGSLGRATGLPSKAGETKTAMPAVAPRATDAAAALPARLRAAALSGDAAAEYEVAVRFAEGRGVPPDMQEAARWFERAATRNLAPAQYRLGSLYEKGNGVKKDLDQARRLYRAAADAGNGKATHNLAVLYAEGMEGKPDYAMAAHWFRKAAERGMPDSQYNLAVLYARGLGVEQNLAESYKWFALAAKQGDQDAAKKRDEVASRLDQSAIVAAKLAVQTFTPEPQPEHAVEVKAPPGGWDGPATPPTAPKAKSSTTTPRRAT